MNIYFVAMIMLHVLNIGINLAKHDEIRIEKYNVFTQLLGSAISITLIYLAIRKGF